ncbi:hypothetical protein PU629_07080 [Pullulanibacillus sp. KACC 23026]|uniref:hypothetical protein n=1 Tax=Pullulanibacillus sp. KACC 23026 TaxID=3028315 RepID=UPI0023AFE3A6|nr:hypothetical protein [Pullulanibacillus sp. KACC 23026]WEG14122.1 hypothetical protein PU629_07080 [Pullulanibacillus sp. KACC 23026]
MNEKQQLDREKRMLENSVWMLKHGQLEDLDSSLVKKWTKSAKAQLKDVRKRKARATAIAKAM